jgi:hypothetical protein
LVRADAYRPQIVAYSLSLLFHSLRRSGHEFDLGQVWARQGMDGMLENCIRNLAIAVQKAILSPPQGMTNVGEWSKKEACWEKIRQLSVPCTQQIDQWIVSKEEFKKAKSDGKKAGMQDDGISLQKNGSRSDIRWLLDCVAQMAQDNRSVTSRRTESGHQGKHHPGIHENQHREGLAQASRNQAAM